MHANKAIHFGHKLFTICMFILDENKATGNRMKAAEKLRQHKMPERTFLELQRTARSQTETETARFGSRTATAKPRWYNPAYRHLRGRTVAATRRNGSTHTHTHTHEAQSGRAARTCQSMQPVQARDTDQMRVSTMPFPSSSTRVPRVDARTTLVRQAKNNARKLACRGDRPASSLAHTHFAVPLTSFRLSRSDACAAPPCWFTANISIHTNALAS